MATELSGYRIELDQEIAVTLTFDIEATGNPDDGFTITRATMLEMAVWLDSDQAEEPQVLCLDKARWLEKFLATHDGEQRKLDESLAEQWESDHTDDDVYANPSWRQAVAAGVD